MGVLQVGAHRRGGHVHQRSPAAPARDAADDAFLVAGVAPPLAAHLADVLPDDRFNRQGVSHRSLYRLGTAHASSVAADRRVGKNNLPAGQQIEGKYAVADAKRQGDPLSRYWVPRLHRVAGWRTIRNRPLGKPLDHHESASLIGSGDHTGSVAARAPVNLGNLYQ